MAAQNHRVSPVELLVVVALAVGVIGAGVAVVAAKFTSRQLFAELEALNREHDRLQIDWGRLQLEQSTYATHSLIESTARDRLEMRLPDPAAVVVVAEPEP
jgi:cell division protein FtsL